jgi:hypothetical protein
MKSLLKKSNARRAKCDERKNEKVLSDQFKRWEDMKNQRNQLKKQRMAYHKNQNQQNA